MFIVCAVTILILCVTSVYMCISLCKRRKQHTEKVTKSMRAEVKMNINALLLCVVTITVVIGLATAVFVHQFGLVVWYVE